MKLTVVKMSYLVGGNFVGIDVKSDGKKYSVFIDGDEQEGESDSAQRAITSAMELVENYLLEER